MKTQLILIMSVLSATTAYADEESFSKERNSRSFESLSIVYETNVTDGDGEIVIKAKAFEGMKHFMIFGPTGKKYHDLHADDLKKIGLAQIVLETAEPDINTVKKAYPEGAYTFIARTVSGALLYEKRQLNHFLAEPPQFTPCDQDNLDPNALTVAWTPSPYAASYEIEIENDDLNVNMTLALTGDTTQVMVPPGFLQPGAEYEIGMTSVTASGNKSVVECNFTTAN